MKPGKLININFFSAHSKQGVSLTWKTFGWRGFALACNEGQQFLSKWASRVERGCIAHRGRNTSWLYFYISVSDVIYFFLCLCGRFGDQDVPWTISFKIRAKIDINIYECVSLKNRNCFCRLSVPGYETTEFREGLPDTHFLVYKYNCTSCNSCNVGETKFSHNWIENLVTDFVSGRFKLKKISCVNYVWIYLLTGRWWSVPGRWQSCFGRAHRRWHGKWGI